MLKKLLKYEFKSVGRKIVPLLLGTLALSIISTVLFTANFRILSDGSTSGFNPMMSILVTTVMFFAIIAIIASVFVAFFMLMHRYYKNFFGDEGYLTFTLPVNVNQHITVKLISGFIWTVLSYLTIFISVITLLIFGTAERGQIVNYEIINKLRDFFGSIMEYIGRTNAVLYIIEGLILAIVYLLSMLLLFYLSITIGSIIAKKHKILTSIGVYFGINTVTGIITNTMFYSIFSRDNIWIIRITSLYKASHINLWCLIILYTILGGIAFVICNKMISKKLNLE